MEREDDKLNYIASTISQSHALIAERMKNPFFPPIFSPYGNLADNEILVPNSNASNVDFERLNYYGNSGIFVGPQVSSELQLGSFTSLSTVSHAQAIDNFPGTDGLMTNSMYGNSSPPKTPRQNSLFADVIRNAEKACFASNFINKETAAKETKKRKAISNQGPHKGPPAESSSSSSTKQAKTSGRKSSKLGDKITALQQLVSPYGKTDTASVLQEVTTHIKLLQDQIQVLSSPYFKILPANYPQGEEETLDLRSRGLCLVPVSSTANLGRASSGVNRGFSTGKIGILGFRSY